MKIVREDQDWLMQGGIDSAPASAGWIGVLAGLGREDVKKELHEMRRMGI